jgi:light-regulated signal transduction histidine kinase (bacteriophytochrome)
MLVEDIADRIALAVTNARLYTDTQRLNVELEQRVRNRTAQLESINSELEAFTYSVSHDLRGPLRHTAGYIELLQRHTGDALDEKGNRYLRVISEEAPRMGDLIDDLLEVSRMGHTDMHVAWFETDQIVREVIRELERVAEGRRVVWEIPPASSCCPTCG